jgi:hypothetical protein
MAAQMAAHGWAVLILGSTLDSTQNRTLRTAAHTPALYRCGVCCPDVKSDARRMAGKFKGGARPNPRTASQLDTKRL